MCCTSPDASECSGEKEFIGARNALLMVLARALRLESGPESKRFKTEVGSVRVADCIPPSLLTSFHTYGERNLSDVQLWTCSI